MNSLIKSMTILIEILFKKEINMDRIKKIKIDLSNILEEL
jgi:hypothetical protein